MIGKFLSDVRGIARVCGPLTAARWVAGIVATLPTVLASRSLLSADRTMGSGPFRVRHAGDEAVLTGRHAFSGVREIWVREVYSKHGFLRIPDHGLVLDLGANMGNFSAMALAANPTARLIAVEPNSRHGAQWATTMRINGFAERAQLCHAFVGDIADDQLAHLRRFPAFADAPHFTEATFLARYAIDHVDFLKCDIEGAEYFMADPDSRMLDITSRVAIEIHDRDPGAQRLLNMLAARGFTDIAVEWHGAECIARAARGDARRCAGIGGMTTSNGLLRWIP